jgi:hypothetical protein
MRKMLFAVAAVLTLVGVGSATAAATPPQNTVSPTISGATRQGETLTADPGTWSGTQPITFTYQWRRCDSNGSSCANIIGATSKTYTLTSADVGNALRVAVRGTNTAGSRVAVSAPTAAITAKAPKSISLDSNRSLVVYGSSVLLSGSVSNGQADEPVTIVEHRMPGVRGLAVRDVTTVHTSADGSFSVAVRPIIHTLYKATTGETSSNAVSILVRPRVSLTHIGLHRFLVRALAARSFRGRYGVVQRWSAPRRHWISLRRVFFTRSYFAGSTTIVSRTTFRARPGGVKIRVILPRSQTTPGYLTGISNSATA